MDKILFVENDPETLKFLMEDLGKYSDNFYILSAKDGEEAIKLLNQNNIALLVTALKIPKVDGLALLSHINKKHREIHCMVMSASVKDIKQLKAYIKVLQPDIMDMFSTDAIRFFRKPFDIDKIAQSIIEALEENCVKGSLNGVSIGSFMQLIEMEQKTCCLKVGSQVEETGIIYFVEGSPHDAFYGFLEGEDALLEILAIDRAIITINNLPVEKLKIENRIKKGLGSMILETLRRMDESKAADSN